MSVISDERVIKFVHMFADGIPRSQQYTQQTRTPPCSTSPSRHRIANGPCCRCVICHFAVRLLPARNVSLNHGVAHYPPRPSSHRTRRHPRRNHRHLQNRKEIRHNLVACLDIEASPCDRAASPEASQRISLFCISMISCGGTRRMTGTSSEWDCTGSSRSLEPYVHIALLTLSFFAGRIIMCDRNSPVPVPERLEDRTGQAAGAQEADDATSKWADLHSRLKPTTIVFRGRPWLAACKLWVQVFPSASLIVFSEDGRCLADDVNDYIGPGLGPSIVAVDKFHRIFDAKVDLLEQDPTLNKSSIVRHRLHRGYQQYAIDCPGQRFHQLQFDDLQSDVWLCDPDFNQGDIVSECVSYKPNTRPRTDDRPNSFAACPRSKESNGDD